MTEKQRKIIHIIAFAIGIISLFLFFKGLYLWAGIGIILMGVIFTCIKVHGGELNIVIGLMPILIQFQQMTLLGFLSIIVMLAGIYDLIMIIQIRKDLKVNGSIKDRKAFNESFREKELFHRLFVKLGKLLALNK